MSEPRPESRISFLEKQYTRLGAQVEELASDQAEELRALREHVDRGFAQAHAFIMENVAMKADLAALETKLEQRMDTMDDKLDKILRRLPEKGGNE